MRGMQRPMPPHKLQDLSTLICMVRMVLSFLHTERTYDVEIGHLRYDNEFNQTEVRHFAQKAGITVEPSVPYAHHQIGT